MKIRYITGPQAFDIKPEGAARSKGVKFAVRGERVVYADDMFLSMIPFFDCGALLMCPSNAQEEAKGLVRKNGGFVSEKRSTEAVAEFLTGIYPVQYQDRHRFIHSIYLDKDGVLWEEERLGQNLPFFPVIADYIRNCEGPYTAHPPISIATGASLESTSRALSHIKLNKENIPCGMSWPLVIFEEGCLAMDPVTGNILDLTEEKYGLFPPDFKKTGLFIADLGREISKRVPEINNQLGAECRACPKERSGYTLDLPLEARSSRDGLRRAHSLIYRNIRDILPEGIEFAGLFTKQELEL